MNNQTFRIIIEPDHKGFHGYVPALRGCHTWGESIAQTKTHLRAAMELHIEALIAHGEAVPNDNSFEAFETIAIQKPLRIVKARSRLRHYA